MEPLEPNTALFLAVSWACGINLYAALGILGYFVARGALILPNELLLLGDSNMLIALGLLYLAGFIIDKTPYVDSIWDGVHTFIRIPGAIVFAYFFFPPSMMLRPVAAVAAGILAAISHSEKLLFRLIVNRSPEPFTNILTSVFEDAMVFGVIWLSVRHSSLFLVVFSFMLLSLYWILPLCWRQALRFFEWPE